MSQPLPPSPASQLPAPPLPGTDGAGELSPPEVSCWRTHALTVGFALIGMVLIARILEIQWWRHAEFSRRAQRLQTTTEPVAARPGMIRDRHGRVLAVSSITHSLFLDPERIADPEQITRQLATVLPLDAERLTDRLRSAQAGGSRFLWVQRRLSPEVAAAVRGLELPAGCYGFRDEFLRTYPQGPIAAHVLGLRDIDNVGRGGIEEAFNTELRGVPGRRRVRRDARGYVVEVLEDESSAPQHGQDIQTTLDSLLQLNVESHLQQLHQASQAKSCCAIVMAPDSGEILALASCPTFDPNTPHPTDAGAWKNQALASIFEPGSTFKPFLVAWALDRQLIQRDERLHCEWGSYRMDRRVLHDHHAYGELDITDILVKSSNIGMAKIGERLTNEELSRACHAFGFGRPTKLGLPGELPGLVHPLERWTSYSTGSIPMGQEIAATPIQIITAHAALANGGKLVPPRITQHAGTNRAGQRAVSATVIAPVVTAETAHWLTAEPMRTVVDRGTGKEARIPGYSVFGKTGTAQVVDPETGRYSHTRHICSFICGAPADNPQVLVLVVVEEPQGPGAQYGGTVAAPVARDILQAALTTLGIPPDLPIADKRDRITR